MVHSCKAKEFYDILTRSQAAIAGGMDVIRRFDKSKYGKGVVRDVPARLKDLGNINGRIADCRHVVGCALSKEEAVELSPWRSSALGCCDSIVM